MKRMILLLVLLLAAGCKANAPKESVGEHLKKPPALTVRAGKAEGSATLGTYSWEWPNADGKYSYLVSGFKIVSIQIHLTILGIYLSRISCEFFLLGVTYWMKRIYLRLQFFILQAIS